MTDQERVFLFKRTRLLILSQFPHVMVQKRLTWHCYEGEIGREPILLSKRISANDRSKANEPTSVYCHGSQPAISYGNGCVTFGCHYNTKKTIPCTQLGITSRAFFRRRENKHMETLALVPLLNVIRYSYMHNLAVTLQIFVLC